MIASSTAAVASPPGATAAPADYWTPDNPPPADGCRWCGLLSAAHKPPHAYEPPTRTERAARIEARRQIALRRLVPCEHCGGAGHRPGAYGAPCPHCVGGWIDPDAEADDIYRGEP